MSDCNYTVTFVFQSVPFYGAANLNDPCNKACPIIHTINATFILLIITCINPNADK